MAFGVDVIGVVLSDVIDDVVVVVSPVAESLFLHAESVTIAPNAVAARTCGNVVRIPRFII